MKQINLFICTLVFSTGFAQESKKIKGDLSSVTLYSLGAMITETGNISLNKGINKLVFTNIARTMDPKVLLLQFSAEAKVVSLTTGKTDMTLWKQDKVYKSILDSIELITRQKMETAYSISAYNSEKIMLDANNSIGGVNTGVSNIELQKAIDFYRLRIANIYKLLVSAQQTELEQNKLLGLLNEKRIALEAGFLKNNTLVYATVLSEKAEETFELRYFVTDCGWAPYYDIKITDISKPVSLVYHAKMVNNTGVDWKDINLTISTADPSKTAQYPALEKWILEEVNSNYENINTKKMYDYVRDKGDQGGIAERKNAKSAQSTISVSELSVNFAIANKKTIPSDAKPYLVEINSIALNPSYQYIAIPKLDALAYLTCGITEWEKYNLVEGPANVYYGKTFIGESYIAPHLADDTLEISLGRDQKVVLKYEKKKDFSRKSFLGNTINQTFTYEISIRNNNSKDISLDLFDQVPLSPNSDISVDVNEISKADLTKEDGKLQWKVNLKAGETAKYLVSYSIKYPKGRTVNTVRYKKLTCPDF